MQAGPDVTIGTANHTISALLALSFTQVPGRGFGVLDHLASRRNLERETTLLRLLPRFSFAYIKSF